MKYQIHTTKSGLQLVYKEEDSPVTYAGFGIKVGSRHEKPRSHGIAHFVEHMLFKGTKSHNSLQIIRRMEEVGAELNAFTEKEATFVYSILPQQHFRRAFNLLADIVRNSYFPEEELKKEKEVIIDEINSYRDSPSELIFDEFENILFKSHPLGHNILGSEGSVSNISSAMGRRFMDEHYRADKMIFFVQGKIDFLELVEQAEYHFDKNCTTPISNCSIGGSGSLEIPKRIEFPMQVRRRRNTYQRHLLIGTYAYSMHDKRRTTLTLLNNILGGPAMNSRLNLSLRENNGLVYNVESNYIPYSDTGLLNIYLGTAPRNVEKAIGLVHEELDKLCQTKLSENELIKAKRQLKGQLCVSSDSRESCFIALGKSIMNYGKYDSQETIFKRIDQICSEEIQAVAQDLLCPDKLLTLTYY